MSADGPVTAASVPADAFDFVPQLRDDIVRRDVGEQCIVWSPLAPQPEVLDPVAALMLDVVDGSASVRDLVTDVHEELGLPLETAANQLTRIVGVFTRAGLLTISTTELDADDAIAQRDPFVSVSTPCSENASRLGTTTLPVRLGRETVRVACDSRRAARLLESALADLLDPDPSGDLPLGFVFAAPQGLKRTHHLSDRSGFVLSEGRGTETGLHALASHLSALLPPRPGTVRIKARALVAGDRTLVCLSPLMYFPALGDADLARLGVDLVDRLALDLDIATGAVMGAEIPWPALAELPSGAGHVGTGGTRVATAIAAVAPSFALPQPTPAEMVAAVAVNGLHGSREDLLDAAIRLVDGATLRCVEPSEQHLTDAIRELLGA